MREAHAARRVDRHEARFLGRCESRLIDERGVRTRERGHAKQCIASRRGQRSHTRAHERAEAVRDRQRRDGVLYAAAFELARDLDRVERVAGRRLCDANQDRSRERPTGCVARGCGGELRPKPVRPRCAPSRAPAGSVASERIEKITRTFSSSSRRRANSSATADGGSSHWRSSIAITTADSAASSRSSVRRAVATTRRVGGPVESARRSATSSPRRWGAGKRVERLRRQGRREIGDAAEREPRLRLRGTRHENRCCRAHAPARQPHARPSSCRYPAHRRSRAPVPFRRETPRLPSAQARGQRPPAYPERTSRTERRLVQSKGNFSSPFPRSLLDFSLEPLRMSDVWSILRSGRRP